MPKDIKQVEKKENHKNLNKKVLVVYFSRGNNTKQVATNIANLLDADIEEIKYVKKPGSIRFITDMAFKRMAKIKDVEKKASNYDIVIVGTPIWAGKVSPPVRAYLNKYFEGSVNSVGFFTLSGGVSPDKVIASMESITKKATSSVGFTQKDINSSGFDSYETKMLSFIDNFYKS